MKTYMLLCGCLENVEALCSTPSSSFEVKAFSPPEALRKEAGVCLCVCPSGIPLCICVSKYAACALLCVLERLCTTMHSHAFIITVRALCEKVCIYMKGDWNFSFFSPPESETRSSRYQWTSSPRFFFSLSLLPPIPSLFMFHCSRDYGDEKRGRKRLHTKNHHW